MQDRTTTVRQMRVTRQGKVTTTTTTTTGAVGLTWSGSGGNQYQDEDRLRSDSYHDGQRHDRPYGCHFSTPLTRGETCDLNDVVQPPWWAYRNSGA